MRTFLGRDKYDWIAMIIVTSIAFGIASLCHKCDIAHAEALSLNCKIDYESLADAIYQTEGSGINGSELYGIHSVHYSSELEARAICIRTCRHKWVKWQKKSIKQPFLEYLSKHYCPKYSKRWLKNVRWFYNKELKQKENAI